MAGLWYRAGTVAVTNASKKVVGTGTTWKNGVSKPDKGHTVWAPDGKAYELDYVESDTVLYLVTAYGGSTTSGVAYAIDISRSGSNSAFSRDLSALVAYHQLQMDGWQQLLTGTGDVTLTAPDGTKLTVPSWEKVMNAGSGVVAMAKTEADRAKNEASKAAVSATAAGDTVAASALPMPDVWVPLSDSLRLITGYGRDVMVGSDVVARMVFFARNSTATYFGKDGKLKTAAANEPRFEKEGLLIEVQSTNLIPRSEGISMSNPGGANTVVQNNIADFLPGFLCVRVTFNAPTTTNGDHVRINPSVLAGKTYTWSIVTDSPDRRVFVYSSNPGVIQNSVFSVTKISEGLWRQTNTFTTSSAFVPGTDYLDVRITAGGAVAGTVVNAGAIQLEELPFASSYIPTNGVAVTRAADLLQFVGAGNHPDIRTGSSFSTAFELDAIWSSGFIYRTGGTGQYNHIDIVDNRLRWHRTSGQQLTAQISYLKKTTVAFSVNSSDECKLKVGAEFASAIRKPTTPGLVTSFEFQNMCGHIRNFRLWHRALTDDQLKATA